MARRPLESEKPASAMVAPEKAAEPAPVEQRVSDLEVLMLSAFTTPVAAGRALARCSYCGAFATRQHRFEHPHSATLVHPACDACEMRHPLREHAASVITTEPVPGYPEECVALGRKINQARLGVLRRVAP